MSLCFSVHLVVASVAMRCASRFDMTAHGGSIGVLSRSSLQGLCGWVVSEIVLDQSIDLSDD